MTWMLRGIKNKNISLYDEIPSTTYLSQNDVEADYFKDIETTKNSLSIWEIDDDKKDLERVIAALASNKNQIEPFSYILFRKEELESAGIEVLQINGDTLDSQINSRHWDIVELTGLKLIELAKILKNNSSNAGQMLKPKITDLIRESISNGNILKDALNKGIKKDLDKQA